MLLNKIIFCGHIDEATLIDTHNTWFNGELTVIIRIEEPVNDVHVFGHFLKGSFKDGSSKMNILIYWVSPVFRMILETEITSPYDFSSVGGT